VDVRLHLARELTPWENPSGWRSAGGRDPRDSKALFSQIFAAINGRPLDGVFTSKGGGDVAELSPRFFNSTIKLSEEEVAARVPQPQGIGHAVTVLNDALVEVFQPGMLELLEPVDPATGASTLHRYQAPEPNTQVSLPRPSAPLECMEFLGLIMGWSLRFAAVLPLDWHPAVWRYLVGAPRGGDCAMLEPRAAAMAALRRGLGAVVPLCALAGMPAAQLAARIAGEATVDVDVLQAHCVYSETDGASEAHPVVQEFWRVLRAWDGEAAKRPLISRLLKAIKGTSRLPPAGVQWHFTLRLAPGGTLCTSSMCLHILKLPALPVGRDGRLEAGKLEWSLELLLSSGCVFLAGGAQARATLHSPTLHGRAHLLLSLSHTQRSHTFTPSCKRTTCSIFFPTGSAAIEKRESERERKRERE
jgi:hypothetical protein